MIFPYVLADKILAGEKTVTRRPVVSKGGRRFNPPKVGELMGIQRGYAKACAYVRVTSVTRERFDAVQISREEIRREGFDFYGEFFEAWTDIYGAVPIDVWRIAFELVPTDGEAMMAAPNAEAE